MIKMGEMIKKLTQKPTKTTKNWQILQINSETKKFQQNRWILHLESENRKEHQIAHP